MKSISNPFAPGAGSQPPELAGRDQIIQDADIALQRILLGRHDRSQILLGLRGTGKTVLLNKIEQLAEHHGHLTSFIEAPEDKTLAELLYPRLHQTLRKLSFVESARVAVYNATRALRAFAGVFKISMDDLSLSVDPEAGTADSGILEYDLSDLFVRVGEAAKAANKAWSLLIDEVQYLSEEELSALIVALHRVNQKSLPIIFFGAGLPQVAALSGNAKSYAERLFKYTTVDKLDRVSAAAAIRQPVVDEGEAISDEALEAIFEHTSGYPYFLQEWGYQSWNIAKASPISAEDVRQASGAALTRLDDGFFRVRFDRLTPKERDYVQAMATLGKGPYRSSDVADVLGETVQALGPCRAKIINKGMIYSPAHGDIAFTVPMFEDYLKRILASAA
ncbi:ATP-binding protein [Asticcacaulis sp. EMRT-3]|uniref:ATP-binding protein n=1 Tax=Asticcacaulis sp. EMRT-3 TaxID=3040349 RepID=UPI0024AFB6FB|nr:ATP-binding protein [Asticcacaulis sp. EMRT-3]MDI7776161.1 ATP-binding protein [Asticcacaulis sp. EMRT-3]